MAKQKVSDKLQAKFNKPQFQVGAAVFFSWLGQKKYGYVKKHKNTGWGVQYMVTSSDGVNYPCGIQIEGQKTTYHTGYILFEDTRSIGQDEIIKRIETTVKPTRIATVSINTGGKEDASRDDDSILPGPDAADNGTISTSKKRGSSKSNAVKPSTAGVRNSNSKKRKDSTEPSLNDAIQRQRDFLNGFVKRD